MNIIFHIDIDSFFVSAHQSLDKSLLKKQAIVSLGQKSSIVLAASYEAKEKGVYVPMPFYKAKKLVPNLINILPNYNLYALLSKKVLEILISYTSKVEIASIDEWYLDASNLYQKEKSVLTLAQKIQNEILNKVKIPVSIGIGTNKFVAKMSTSINKPFGITITKPSDFAKTFWSLPIEKYYGIGKSTALKLKQINILTIGDLANAYPKNIEKVLGKKANAFILQANGQGNTLVNPEENELKSIGNSQTFLERKLSNNHILIKELLALVNKITLRAKRRNFVGKVFRLEIQNEDDKKVSKQITLERKTNDYKVLAKIAINLFEDLWKDKSVRFLGVSLNDLTKVFDYKYQGNLFEKTKNKSKTEQIVDQINQKFQKEVVQTGKNFVLKQKEKVSKYLEEEN